VLKPHLSALAVVDSDGITAVAVGGRAFLTYFICLFEFFGNSNKMYL
jgi:hypothetical protein